MSLGLAPASRRKKLVSRSDRSGLARGDVGFQWLGRSRACGRRGPQPSRNIPLALIGGIGLLGLLYVSANIAYHAVVPWMSWSIRRIGDTLPRFSSDNSFGNGYALMSFGIVLSTLGTINSNLLTSPRVAYAMGRDVCCQLDSPVFILDSVHRFRHSISSDDGCVWWLSRCLDPVQRYTFARTPFLICSPTASFLPRVYFMRSL